MYEKQKKIFSQKYEENRKEIKVVYDRESSKIAKSLEDIKKYRDAYMNILEDLNERKKRLNEEHM